VSLLLFSHEQKWSVLYELLNALPAEELQLVERVLTRLEIDRCGRTFGRYLPKIGSRENSRGWMGSSEKCGQISGNVSHDCGLGHQRGDSGIEEGSGSDLITSAVQLDRVV
jgi:hypothetical protein